MLSAANLKPGVLSDMEPSGRAGPPLTNVSESIVLQERILPPRILGGLCIMT